MPIEPPLPNDTRSRFADWVEVASLIQPRGAGSGDLASLYGTTQDSEHDIEFDEATGEHLETEILEEDQVLFTDQVLAEVEYRTEVLGSDYPFVIETAGNGWRVLPADEPSDDQCAVARCCYVFCLLVSALRDKRIHGSRTIELKQFMERLFQDVAVDAAAAIVCGDGISFGWPRLQGTGFRAALDGACDRLGLGTPLPRLPAWSSGQEKDAGIDVIAWREFRDRRPGKLVMLGQVASGLDWPKKSVKNDTYRFFAWFSIRPTAHFVPAIFIPFPQHHECYPRSGVPFDDAAFGEAWHREQYLGLVVDRMRIVEVAAARLADSGGVLQTLRDWVHGALDLARSAA